MYHNLFIHSSVDGHLGCFHVLAVVNSAPVNTGVYMSFSIMISSEYMLSSGIVGSYGEGSGNPLQCSCLENPRDGGTWGAAIYGVAQSWMQLMRLSSSSSSMVVLLLVFKGISIPSSIVAVSIYIPTCSARQFPFLHTLCSIYCL